MNDKVQSSRRRFLKSALVAGAGFTIIPRHVLGGMDIYNLPINLQKLL